MARFAWLSGAPELDLIVTMDDATSTIYSAFLVEEEGTVSTFCGLLEAFTAKGPSGEPLYRSRQPLFLHAEGGGGGRQEQADAGWARARSAWHRAYCGLFAGGARALGADVRDTARSAAEGAQARRDLRDRGRQSVHPRGLSSGA